MTDDKTKLTRINESLQHAEKVVGIVPLSGQFGTVPEQPYHFPSATTKDENGGASAGKVARNKMVT